MSLTPSSLRTVNATPSGAPRPLFVVMFMTPLPARAPYNEAPAAPFTTSTRSMSPELMSGSAPLMMTPSTMYNGSCPRPVALIEVGPRSSTDGCEPGRPLLDTILAAILPCSWRSGSSPATGIFEASIRVTLNGTLICSVASCTPVTTTSSNRFGSVASVKSCEWSPGVRVSRSTAGL